MHRQEDDKVDAVINSSDLQHGTTLRHALLCRIVQYLPDMQFVVNDLDEPRVLPGETDDIDARFNSSQCAKASKDFLEYRHLHGTFNNRSDFSPLYVTRHAAQLMVACRNCS